MKENKSLVFRYNLQQIVYELGHCSLGSFAVLYLLSVGFDTAWAGIILFGMNTFSFIIQPIVGSWADKSKNNIIQKILFGQALIAATIFTILYFFNVKLWIIGVFYPIAVSLVDTEQALQNSESVYYASRNWKINYGSGRAFGSLSYAFCSITLGYVMKSFGEKTSLLVSVFFLAIYALICITFPKDETYIEEKKEKPEASSFPEFVKKYGWFTVSLIGLMLFAIVHLMLENFMIETLTPIGGDSSSVGTGLFIATAIAVPSFFLIEKIYKKIGSLKMFVISGLFYAVKALIFYVAKSPVYIYVAEGLQIITFALFSPTLLYYAKECIAEEDSFKGQSMCMACYSLGCGLGNLIGGYLTSAIGVRLMNLCAAGLAVLGVIVLLICIPKAIRKV